MVGHPNNGASDNGRFYLLVDYTIVPVLTMLFTLESLVSGIRLSRYSIASIR